ncbi:MAG: VUT family protein [Proteobacteria bacterium]|nr:VUT family protein [Pseudomonadota bacterium]
MNKYAILLGYAATIPAANWMISNVGVFCVPDGPCLIPVFPGVMAPSGVLMIGLALILRDAVHEILGARWAVGAIIAGAVLSYLLADPYIAVASLAAFAISEFSDFAVYSKLRERSKYLAMGASGVVGSVIDSVIFLWMAFGSLAHIEGQIIGKIGVTLIATWAVWFWRKHRVLAE